MLFDIPQCFRQISGLFKRFIDGEFSSTDNKEEIIEINPEDLLRQIQRYVSGETVYIPRPDGSCKRQWGETSGYQQFIRERNAEIRSSFSCEKSIEELSEIYCLSYSLEFVRNDINIIFKSVRT